MDWFAFIYHQYVSIYFHLTTMIAESTAPRAPRITFKKPYAKLTYPVPRGAKHDLKLVFEMRDYFKRSMKAGLAHLSNCSINFSGLKDVKITVPIFIHGSVHQHGLVLWNRIEYLVNERGVRPKHAVEVLTGLTDASVNALDGLASGLPNQDPAAVVRLAAELPGETGFSLICEMNDKRHLIAMDTLLTCCKLSVRHAIETVANMSEVHLDLLGRISAQTPPSANDAWELRRLSRSLFLPKSEPAKAIKERTDGVLLKKAFDELRVPDNEKTILDGLGAKFDGFHLYECVRGLTVERNELDMLTSYVGVLQTEGAPAAAKLLQDRIDNLS